MEKYKLTLFIALFTFQCSIAEPAKNIVLEAFYNKSGGYDDIWRINIREHVDLSGGMLNYEYSHGVHLSSLKGELLLDSENLKKLKDKLYEVNFFELPGDFYEDPYVLVPLHATQFIIKICKGEQCHKVEIYDPESIPISIKRNDFFGLWESIIDLLPNWPKIPLSVLPIK